MASIKNLKKDINYTLGDLIEECYVYQLLNPKADVKASEVLIDEAIATFDDLIAKLNAKKFIYAVYINSDIYIFNISKLEENNYNLFTHN